MKRRMTLSIALTLSAVLLSLMSFDSPVNAQNQMRVVADTGDVTIGQNQILRVTITGGGVHNDGETYGVRFRQMSYTEGTCSGGVCKHSVASQTTSAPITLMPDEAASFDIPASFKGGVFVGVRGVVLSNRRDVQVNASIIDSATGEVITSWATFPSSQSSGGVCKLAVASETTSDPVTLMPDEAASMDITPMPNSAGVRGVVETNSLIEARHAGILGIVIDTSTQRVVTALDLNDLF